MSDGPGLCMEMDRGYRRGGYPGVARPTTDHQTRIAARWFARRAGEPGNLPERDDGTGGELPTPFDGDDPGAGLSHVPLADVDDLGRVSFPSPPRNVSRGTADIAARVYELARDLLKLAADAYDIAGCPTNPIKLIPERDQRDATEHRP